MVALLNPFAKLYEKQNTGTAQEKHDTLPDFPRLIDIEPVGLCNFRCVCCPTGLQTLTRKQGFMDADTFDSIVEQCAEHGTAIRFIGWGEPLLHPKIVSFVFTATGYGLLTHLNTNASKLTPDLAEQLVDAGLSSIKFSFQGVDRETYAETRQTDFFGGMLRAIEIMGEARGHRALPYIAASTSTTYETPEQIDKFRALMEPLVDYLSIGKTIFDFIDAKASRAKPNQIAAHVRLKALQTQDLKHPDPCPEVWDKLSIAWDGSIRVCCNDYNGVTNLGQAKDSIAQAWNHSTMQEYRARLLNKEYSGPLCGSCYDYAGLVDAP